MRAAIAHVGRVLSLYMCGLALTLWIAPHADGATFASPLGFAFALGWLAHVGLTYLEGRGPRLE